MLEAGENLSGAAADGENIGAWEDEDASLEYQQYLSDLAGDGGSGDPGSALNALTAQLVQQNAQQAQRVAAQTAGATPFGLAALINQGIRAVNAALNSYGMEINSTGIHYTTLTQLPDTKNEYVDPNAINAYDQGNFLVNWNFISFADMGPAAWNSAAMRYFVPDVIGVNVGFSQSLGVGYGGNAQIFILTRGKDIGIHATYSFSARLGIDVGVSATIFMGWFLADPREATLNSLLGIGGNFSGSFDDFTGDIWTSISTSGKLSWLGYGYGVGAGPPIGPGFGLSGGASVTNSIFNLNLFK